MSENFAELFEESLNEINMTPGAIVIGTIVDIDSDWVTVNAGLKSEGIAIPVVLWALSREIRALAEMAFELEQGGSAERVMGAYRVWEKRKPLIRRGLKQPAGHWRRLLVECARTDRLIKGLGRDDPWLHLQDIAVGISGVRLSV